MKEKCQAFSVVTWRLFSLQSLSVTITLLTFSVVALHLNMLDASFFLLFFPGGFFYSDLLLLKQYTRTLLMFLLAVTHTYKGNVRDCGATLRLGWGGGHD